MAFAIFASALLRAVEAETARGYPEAWLAVVAIPVGLFLLRRPLALGLVMALAGVYLRALYLSSPETCDQLAVSRAAFGVASGGGNPYGIGYAESWPPGSPVPVRTAGDARGDAGRARWRWSRWLARCSSSPSRAR